MRASGAAGPQLLSCCCSNLTGLELSDKKCARSGGTKHFGSRVHRAELDPLLRQFEHERAQARAAEREAAEWDRFLRCVAVPAPKQVTQLWPCAWPQGAPTSRRGAALLTVTPLRRPLCAARQRVALAEFIARHAQEAKESDSRDLAEACAACEVWGGARTAPKEGGLWDARTRLHQRLVCSRGALSRVAICALGLAAGLPHRAAGGAAGAAGSAARGRRQ